MRNNTDPNKADTDGDGINDGSDKYPLDRDNDGIADLQDQFPTIPQNYIYAGLVIGGIFAKSRSKKKFSANFYDNLNLQISPEKESYEVGSTASFIVSISNNIGDIASGRIESNLFNTIELTK